MGGLVNEDWLRCAVVIQVRRAQQTWLEQAKPWSSAASPPPCAREADVPAVELAPCCARPRHAGSVPCGSVVADKSTETGGPAFEAYYIGLQACVG